ncbi:hypothetical protein C7M84_007650 [Penaeus vannamei]|uniref:Uncharacterized protein n=1 Tax=Penaeus vannamei TaxID=6689 RepID=A0A3R7N0C2_PENVA|nr:hypothetical protein C7M84_007650 [Penaeus vannamei]
MVPPAGTPPAAAGGLAAPAVPRGRPGVPGLPPAVASPRSTPTPFKLRRFSMGTDRAGSPCASNPGAASVLQMTAAQLEQHMAATQAAKQAAMNLQQQQQQQQQFAAQNYHQQSAQDHAQQNSDGPAEPPLQQQQQTGVFYPMPQHPASPSPAPQQKTVFENPRRALATTNSHAVSRHAPQQDMQRPYRHSPILFRDPATEPRSPPASRPGSVVLRERDPNSPTPGSRPTSALLRDRKGKKKTTQNNLSSPLHPLWFIFLAPPSLSLSRLSPVFFLSLLLAALLFSFSFLFVLDRFSSLFPIFRGSSSLSLTRFSLRLLSSSLVVFPSPISPILPLPSPPLCSPSSFFLIDGFFPSPPLFARAPLFSSFPLSSHSPPPTFPTLIPSLPLHPLSSFFLPPSSFPFTPLSFSSPLHLSLLFPLFSFSPSFSSLPPLLLSPSPASLFPSNTGYFSHQYDIF